MLINILHFDKNYEILEVTEKGCMHCFSPKYYDASIKSNKIILCFLFIICNETVSETVMIFILE